MFTQKQKESHRKIVSLIETNISRIEGGEERVEAALDALYDEIRKLLSSDPLSIKQTLSHLVIKDDGSSPTPLLHHAISQIKIGDPKSILFMKQIANLLVKYGADPSQLDSERKSYHDLYIDKLFEFIAENVSRHNAQPLEYHLPSIAEDDVASLKEALRSNVIYQGLAFPFPQYCIASVLMSSDIKPEDVPELVTKQMKLAELLMRHGASSSQLDYKNRTYDGYLDMKCTRFLFKQIHQYVISSDPDKSTKLDQYLSKINPILLEATLENAIRADKKGMIMPIQHYYLYLNSHSNHALMEAQDVTYILLKYANPKQEDYMGRTFDQYLTELEHSLSGRSSAPAAAKEELHLPLSISPLDELSPGRTPDTPKLQKGEKAFTTRGIDGDAFFTSTVPAGEAAAAGSGYIPLSSEPAKSGSVTPREPSKVPSPAKITKGFDTAERVKGTANSSARE